MISKILVPTDGSGIAQKAAAYAVKLAKEIGAEVVLLNVIDKRFIVSRSIPAIASPTHLTDTIEDYLMLAAEAFMGEIIELCKKNNVRSRAVIRKGHPVEEILKEAKKSKVDIIIVGSHGRSALKAAVLGSVTTGVMHATNIPVLIVRG
ncbi:MAG: universal stress protein [Nitrospirae bacterium]|nr:universal stress protein [Nitrospirota bacterium]